MSTKKICIPHLDMKVDWDDPEQDTRNVVISVRQGWTGKDIEVKKLSGGYVNMIFACSIKEDNNKLVVRVFKAGTEVFSNRDAELTGLCISAEAGVGPTIHATFNNGIVMDYVPGTMPQYHHLSSPKFMRAIGKCMGKFHSVGQKHFDIFDGDRKLPVLTKSMMFDELDININNIPDPSEKPERQQWMLACMGSREKLKCEASLLRQHIEDLDLDVVWSHNDLYTNNIIYDENTESTYVIDHEIGALNYELHDFGMLLININVLQACGLAKKEDKYPSPDVIKLMLKEYICTRRLSKPGSDDVTGEDVDRAYTILRKLCVVCAFWWGCFCLAYMDSLDKVTIDLDNKLFTESCLTTYWKDREVIFGVKED